MEKIVIQIWKNHEIDDNDFKNFLVNEIPSNLRSDLTSYQVNLPDKDVSKAAGLVQSSYPPSPNAIVFLKVKSLFHVEQKLKVFESHAEKLFSYIVSESKIIEVDESKNLNKRTEGFSQIVFLEKPDNVDRFDWFDHWTHHHTKIAIETQSNFIYVQNSVVRKLQKQAPNFIAIVEECFPSQAMSDQEEFYAARGDATLMKKNLEIMMDSCNAFIDFSKIEVIPTSRYLVI
jgi:hypothetical protein